MEALLYAVECVIHDSCHIVKEPIALSCGHSICKKCIPERGIELICCKCKETNKKNLKRPKVSIPIQSLLNQNIKNLINHAKSKFESLSTQMSGYKRIKYSIIKIIFFTYFRLFKQFRVNIVSKAGFNQR